MFVAVFIGNDGQMGRTLLCESFTDAVAASVVLAMENGYSVLLERLEFHGCAAFDDGASVQIGQLENFR